MSVYDNKAAQVVAPYGDGSANTNVRLFTCDSTSRPNAIPGDWAGKIVRISNETANLAQFFFSKSSVASCDETLAATDAGQASPSLGDSIAGNSEIHVLIPNKESHETIYFVRASVTPTSLRMRLAST
jgi:hypothetical protein